MQSITVATENKNMAPALWGAKTGSWQMQAHGAAERGPAFRPDFLLAQTLTLATSLPLWASVSPAK